MSESITTAPDADAIERLINAGIETARADDRVIEIEVSDGDTSLTVPVLIGDAGDSGPVARVLTSAIEEGTALARKIRLANAPGPDARIGTAKLQSIGSFVDHINRFKDHGSAVWADTAARRLVSVLDYHPAGAESAARWGRHRGEYGCPLSLAWQQWGAGKALVLGQEDFARFLDAHDAELMEAPGFPAPAALITMAANLDTYATCKATRKRAPNTGRVSVSYTSETGTGGDVAPPRAFAISIPIFTDGEAEQIEVRLRVDVSKDGAAAFTFQIHRADEHLRAAFGALCAKVSADAGVPVYQGTPEQ